MSGSRSFFDSEYVTSPQTFANWNAGAIADFKTLSFKEHLSGILEIMEYDNRGIADGYVMPSKVQLSRLLVHSEGR